MRYDFFSVINFWYTRKEEKTAEIWANFSMTFEQKTSQLGYYLEYMNETWHPHAVFTAESISAVKFEIF